MNEPTIHFQGVGRVPVKPVGELRPGDKTAWNYGYVYEVVSVTPAGRSSVTVVSRDPRTGTEHRNRRQLDRLIGVSR